LIIDQLNLEVPPGDYHFALRVRDKKSKKTGIYRSEISVQSYSGDKLGLSDVELAQSIVPGEKRPFGKKGLIVLPHPARRFEKGQPLYIYWEIYNLRQDTKGQTHFRVELRISSSKRERILPLKVLSGMGKVIGVTRRKGEVATQYEYQGNSIDEVMHLALDVGKFPEGEYTLSLTVKDLITEQGVGKCQRFQIVKAK